MLTCVRRITTISFYRSSPAFGGPRSCWGLLHHFPFTTATTHHPNTATTTTTHQDTFKAYGFTDTQIAEIARKAPWITPPRFKNLLSSKMSYLFNDSGLDRPFLVKLITCYPTVLRSSLKNAIIPSITYLDSLIHNPAEVTKAIGRAPILLVSSHISVATNIAMLKDSGVPHSHVAKLLVLQPRTLTRNPERFRELLNAVFAAKFDPSKATFVHAIRVKSAMADSIWEKKIRAYVSFGWSIEEARLAFMKCPFVYLKSVETLKKVLGFLSNVLNIGVRDVLSYPKLMTVSLEKTLMPRCCVLNVLMGRGLLKTIRYLPCALSSTAEKFQKSYVEKYQDDVPEVLDAYNGKMEFTGFDHQR